MTRVLVTGATGIIGSNIAAQLAGRGDEVQALVRPGSDAGPLEALGVRIVRGDLTDADAVGAAVRGMEVVVHSAAVLGGASQTPEEHVAVNVRGAGHVFDAAAAHGARRVVALTTTTYFEHRSAPLTEHSALDPEPSTDPYTVTKRAAFVDAMARAEAGQDICVVVCGGAYGPSPLAQRSMVAPSFNQRLCAALTGEAASYLEFPVPWVLASDVARVAVAAIDRGRAGERYLAFGRPEDVGTIPFFCNRGAEIAGVAHRVAAVGREALDDPAVAERYGPSLVALAKRTFPDPWFVNDETRERLGYRPVALDDGLAQTIPWLAEHGYLPGVQLHLA